MSDAKLRAARAWIAEALSPPPVEPELGSIRLRDDQCRIVARVSAAIARHRGCLLADDVGRGKTYVALAVARAWKRPLIVVPASLRATWSEAMRRAGCTHPVVTHEALSHGHHPALEPDGVIVDESHRFRNAATRRHAMLARIVARCPLLLLSATPVQNGTRDLAAQLALFLGSVAFRRDERLLARHVVRGGDLGADGSLPHLAAPRWVRPDVDDGAVLRAILALPPPPRPADGGDAGALRAIGLVRAWASSRAALRAMLARRRRLAAAIEQSIEGGRLPSLRELCAWEGPDDGAVQLGFVPLLVERTADGEQLRLLARQIADERRASAALEAVMTRSDDPDLARCTALRAIRQAHPDERLLAFAEHASTVRAYYSALRHDAGVGMLTAGDARIASGRLTRDELLARFAPRAQGARTAAPRERVTLLLATDLLSEGVNLQDASVVVHLDLPWNPARLTQRVGRVRRAGGAATVHTYVLAPPASSELLLRMEDRLRGKLAHAAACIGLTLPVLPLLSEERDRDTATTHAVDASSAAAYATMLQRVARWRRDPPHAPPSFQRPLVAGVQASRIGWLAALSDGRLIASLDGAPPDDRQSVTSAVSLADGESRAVLPAESEAALDSVRRWLRSEAAVRACGAAEATAPVRQVVERRLAELLRRAPRHARSALLSLTAPLREALRRPPSLGAERALTALLQVTPASPNEIAGWLRKGIAVLSSDVVHHDELTHEPCVVAMILLAAPPRAS